MDWTRRKFLWAGSLSLAAGAFGVAAHRGRRDSGLITPLEKPWMIVTDQPPGSIPSHISRFERTPRIKCRFYVVDLRTHRVVQNREIDMFPHSWIQHPSEPRYHWAVSKGGREFAFVDLKSSAAPEIFEPPEGIRFYGHGLAFEGGELWLSAQNDRTDEGLVLVYRGNKLTEMRPSFGEFPHELKFSADGRNLIVANLGGKGRQPGKASAGLSWIDPKTWTLRHHSATTMSLGPGHFRFLDNEPGAIFALGVHRTAAVEIYPAQFGEAIQIDSRISLKERPLVETLNATVDLFDPNRMWVTIARGPGFVLNIDLAKRVVSQVLDRSVTSLVLPLDGKMWRSTSEGMLRPMERNDAAEDFPCGNGSHATFTREV